MTDWRAFQRQQKLAELDGTFISYLDEGHGEPVVLLHGIPTWSFCWEPVLGSLVRHGRVLAPDLPGFGFSDKRDTFDRSIGRQAERIDEWMARIGLASATIVGHDIGGGVALRLATRFPARVRKLCVINTVSYDSWPVELMLQFGHPGVNRLLSARRAVSLLTHALKSGFATVPASPMLEGLLAPYATEIGKLSLIRNAAALNTNLTTEIAPLLPSISVPTLILWGEEDPFQPIAYGERLRWDIPGARLLRLRGARHFAMFDRPDDVASAVIGLIGGR